MRDHLFSRSRLAVITVLAALLALAGCSPASSNSENEAGTQVLARFEGGEVTRAEFNEQLELVAQQSAQGGGDQLPSEGDPQFGQVVAQIMPQLVQTEIAKAYAQENGITVSEEDVDEEIERLKEQIGEQARSQGQDLSDDEAYQQALEQAGFKEEKLRSDIREQLPLQKVQERVTADAGPSDEEVRGYYEENKESLAQPEERCARHILFPPDAKEKAEEVKQKLEDGGDFGALAKEYSQDPGTADKGGDLECQPETDQSGQPTYAPAFNDALFADDAEEGDLIGPVKTEFGYHIIQLRETKKKSTPPFEEVEGQIRDTLTQEAQSAEFQQWLEKQTERRDVRYKKGFDPEEVGPVSGSTTGGQG